MRCWGGPSYPVGWASSRQATAVGSSMGAELLAMTVAVSNGVSVRDLQAPLCGHEDDEARRPWTTLVTDSRAARDAVLKQGCSTRVKHVETKVFFLQSWVTKKDNKLASAGTSEMWADPLTKVATKNWSDVHLKNLGLRRRP